MHLLLHHCDREAPADLHRADARLTRVVEFMREPVSRAAVVQETSGKTPLHYPTRMRMEAAKHYFESGQMPVRAVATLCGYDNPANFAAA
jgi:transcriptional regulator GlxA family with amidase domain